MSDDVAAEHPLLVHARRYASAPKSENARSNFIVRLQITTERELVRGIARQYVLKPEVALPAWLRLATLVKDDANILLEAASALYSHGLDEAALQLIEQAIASDPRAIPALELKAALTPDRQERRRIFEDILKIDPGNRVAVDNLILLDRPR